MSIDQAVRYFHQAPQRRRTVRPLGTALPEILGLSSRTFGNATDWNLAIEVAEHEDLDARCLFMRDGLCFCLAFAAADTRDVRRLLATHPMRERHGAPIVITRTADLTTSCVRPASTQRPACAIGSPGGSRVKCLDKCRAFRDAVAWRIEASADEPVGSRAVS